MPDQEEAKQCLTKACRAAKRGDSTAATINLTRFNEMKILEDIAKKQDLMSTPVPAQTPSLKDQLPQWMQQIIRDEGIRIGKDLVIKKGPGTAGVKLELKF
jgi:hypothetical protein